MDDLLILIPQIPNPKVNKQIIKFSGIDSK